MTDVLYVLEPGGTTPLGPFDLKEIINRLMKGAVPEETLYAFPGQQWLKAADCLVISSALANASAQATAHPTQSIQPIQTMPSTQPTEATKRCPFCAETILVVAQKCKHCQSDLGPNAAAANANAKETVGTLLVALPLISTFLIWFWVGSMNLFQDPAGSLTLLVVGTVVGSAILIAVDASSCGAGAVTDLDAKGRKRSGPIVWLIFTVVFWVGAFPAWLHIRKSYGRRSLLVVGLLMVVIFFASFWMMGTAIDGQKEKIRNRFNEYSSNF